MFISWSWRYTLCLCMYNTPECQTNVAMVQPHVPAIVNNVSWLSAKTMCNPPSPSCCLEECPVCPGTHLLKEELVVSLEKSDVDEIIFKQWVSTDRSTLETFAHQLKTLLSFFCEKLEVLQPHSIFIVKQQSAFIQVIR